MRHPTLEYREEGLPSPRGQDSVVPISYELSLRDIEFSREARLTLGLAVMEIASSLAIEAAQLTRRMPGKVFCLGSTGKLMIEFSVPELEADMFVEIPAEHWHFKTRNTRTH